MAVGVGVGLAAVAVDVAGVAAANGCVVQGTRISRGGGGESRGLAGTCWISMRTASGKPDCPLKVLAEPLVLVDGLGLGVAPDAVVLRPVKSQLVCQFAPS